MKQIFRGYDGELCTEIFGGQIISPHEIGCIDVVLDGRPVLEVIPPEKIPEGTDAYCLSWTHYSTIQDQVIGRVEFYSERRY